MSSENQSEILDDGREIYELRSRGDHFSIPDKLLFNINYVHSVESTAEGRTEKFNALLEDSTQKLFRDSPFQEPPDFVLSLREILDHNEFREIFNFTN